MAARNLLERLGQGEWRGERFSCLSLVERDRRWEIIRAKMDTRGLECLVVYGYNKPGIGNVAYLSSIFVPGEGGLLVIFPRRGPVVCFMGGNLANLQMWRDSQEWVTDIRPVPQRLAWSKGAADMLTELKLERGHIGLVGLSSRYVPEGWLSNVFVERLKERLPEATFEEATDLIEDTRLVKSEEEIKLIERASEIGDRAISRLPRYAKAGITSRSLYGRLVWSLIEEGSEIPFVLWDAGPSPVHGVWLPGDRILQPGDVIVTEFSTVLAGYGAQFQRPMAIGYVPDVYARLFEAAATAYWRGLEILRPGITFGDLTRAMAEPVQVAGFETVTPFYHGYGIWNEFPVAFSASRLRKSTLANQEWQRRMEQFEVKAGMVLAFEPNAVTPGHQQGVHVGDTVVVTEAGARRLSKLSLECTVV